MNFQTSGLGGGQTLTTISDNNGVPGVDPQLPGFVYLHGVPDRTSGPGSPPLNVTTANGNFRVAPSTTGFPGMFSANFGFGVSVDLGLTVIDLGGVPGEVDVFFDQHYEGVTPFPTFYLEFLTASFSESAMSTAIGNSASLTVNSPSLIGGHSLSVTDQTPGALTPPGATDSAIVLVPSQVNDVSISMSFIFQTGVVAGDSITLPGGFRAVPEPSSLVLFGSGALVMAGCLAHRRGLASPLIARHLMAAIRES
jgi:hypothetical protein